MRVPLPPLEELDEHPIGRRAGQSLYLCRVTSTPKYLEIERSEVFSEHYGEEVFICSQELTQNNAAYEA